MNNFQQLEPARSSVTGRSNWAKQAFSVILEVFSHVLLMPKTVSLAGLLSYIIVQDLPSPFSASPNNPH